MKLKTQLKKIRFGWLFGQLVELYGHSVVVVLLMSVSLSGCLVENLFTQTVSTNQTNVMKINTISTNGLVAESEKLNPLSTTITKIGTNVVLPEKSLKELEEEYLFISTNKDYQQEKSIIKYGTYKEQMKLLKKTIQKVEDLRRIEKKRQIQIKKSKKELQVAKRGGATNQTLIKKLESNIDANNSQSLTDETEFKIKAYGDLYTKLIEPSYDKFPSEKFKLFLIQWSGFFKRKEKVAWLKEIINKPTSQIKGPQIAEKKMTLQALAKIVKRDDEDQQNLFFDYYREKKFNGGHREIKLAAVNWFHRVPPERFYYDFKSDLEKERIPELKVSLMTVVTAYKKTNDIEFVRRQIDKETSIYLKISYLNLLTNYASNQQASAIAEELYRNKDKRLAAEALRVLGHFSMSYAFYLRAGKRDDEDVRLTAVKQLVRPEYNVEEVNLYLRYKAKSDKEFRVRQAAIRILKQRDLWSKEDEQLESCTPYCK